LAQAAGSLNHSTSTWSVGLIVPGGTKARSDVEDLARTPDLCVDERVVPRGSDDLPAKMASAVTELGRNDALLIAYGGGDSRMLDRVHRALYEPLNSVQKPTWVAVGHSDDRVEIDNPLVRVCRTPSDARALLLYELVEYPKRVGSAITTFLNPGVRRVVPRDAVHALAEQLALLEDQFASAVAQRCQP
jgi:hypothetical protein